MKGSMCSFAHPRLEWAILAVPSVGFHGKPGSERNPA
jgi:hypothetical protein